MNTSTSPKVQYAYSGMPSGADHSRLTSVTYPDGYVLTYNYSSGLNDSISRLSSLSDSTGTLESYDYLGVGTVVRRAHPQPNVDLSYVKRTGESNGDAGDQYTGLDRFGRVIDQRWLDPTTGAATDRFQYAYDLVGDRTYRDNLVNSAFGDPARVTQVTALSSPSRRSDMSSHPTSPDPADEPPPVWLTTYTSDDQGRAVRSFTPPGPVSHTAYDGFGRRIGPAGPPAAPAPGRGDPPDEPHIVG